MTTTLAHATARATTAPIGAMLWQQTKCELLKLWRIPAFSVASLALPVIFYGFFGLPNGHAVEQGVTINRYLAASFGAYGVIAVMLFSFGVSVAVERGQKMTVLLRATPLRPGVFLLAKVITAVVFAFLMLAILFGFVAVAGGVRMDAVTWLSLAVRLVLGSIPFIALGFSIGYWTGPNSAPAITNLLFLVLSFASGLFVPLSQLPHAVQQLAPYLPAYRLGQLAWSAVGAGDSSPHPAALWLAGYTLVFVVIAVRGYWREENTTFG